MTSPWKNLLRCSSNTRHILSTIKKTDFLKNQKSPLISYSREIAQSKKVVVFPQSQPNKPICSVTLEKPPNKKKNFSSVSMLMYEKCEKPHVLFIKRNDVGRHASQIGFPGGMIEEGETYEQCCIRETKEEIGLSPEEHDLEILNELPLASTFTTQIFVKPFIGTFDRTKVDDWKPQESEVESVLEIPLEELIKSYKSEGKLRVPQKGNIYQIITPIFSIPNHTDTVIWGLTARILIYTFNELEENLSF